MWPPAERAMARTSERRSHCCLLFGKGAVRERDAERERDVWFLLGRRVLSSESAFSFIPEMQEPRALPLGEVSKSKKKKLLTQMASGIQTKGETKGGKVASLPFHEAQKGSKRSSKNDASPPYQQTDRSTPDSLLDAPGSGSDYRALRHKYLLLEEESFSIGKELSEVEAEVEALEDEKFALLDKLVVLEGLIDPSELQPQGGL